MFFSTKSEKLVKKSYKLHRELFAATRRALKKSSQSRWKYVAFTADNLREVLEELKTDKSESYANGIALTLTKERSFSEEIQIKISVELIRHGYYNSWTANAWMFDNDEAVTHEGAELSDPAHYENLIALKGCGPATAEKIIEKVQSGNPLTDRERGFWDRI